MFGNKHSSPRHRMNHSFLLVAVDGSRKQSEAGEDIRSKSCSHEATLLCCKSLFPFAQHVCLCVQTGRTTGIGSVRPGEKMQFGRRDRTKGKNTNGSGMYRLSCVPKEQVRNRYPTTQYISNNPSYQKKPATDIEGLLHGPKLAPEYIKLGGGGSFDAPTRRR